MSVAWFLLTMLRKLDSKTLATKGTTYRSSCWPFTYASSSRDLTSRSWEKKNVLADSKTKQETHSVKGKSRTSEQFLLCKGSACFWPVLSCPTSGPDSSAGSDQRSWQLPCQKSREPERERQYLRYNPTVQCCDGRWKKQTNSRM